MTKSGDTRQDLTVDRRRCVAARGDRCVPSREQSRITDDLNDERAELPLHTLADVLEVLRGDSLPDREAAAFSVRRSPRASGRGPPACGYLTAGAPLPAGRRDHALAGRRDLGSCAPGARAESDRRGEKSRSCWRRYADAGDTAADLGPARRRVDLVTLCGLPTWRLASRGAPRCPGSWGEGLPSSRRSSAGRWYARSCGVCSR